MINESSIRPGLYWCWRADGHPPQVVEVVGGPWRDGLGVYALGLETQRELPEFLTEIEHMQRIETPARPK